MRALLYLLCGLLGVAFLGDAEGNSGAAHAAGSPPARDGGTLDRAVEGVQARSAVDVGLRAFLWRHWRQRSHARITVVGMTTHGDHYQSVYRVEPDEAGVWRVDVERTGRFFNGDRRVHEDESYRYQAYSGELIRAKPI